MSKKAENFIERETETIQNPEVQIFPDYQGEVKPEVKPEDPEIIQEEISKIKQGVIGSWESGEQVSKPEDEKGLFGSIRKGIQRFVNESRLPNEDYKSTVGVYGGKMRYDEDGKMVYDRRGMVSKIDTAGDGILRSFDEHVVKEPWKMLIAHPKLFLKSLFNPGTKRYRGSNEEIIENVKNLGLSDYYGANKNGIEIKNPEIYTHGVVLQDVYRADVVGSEKLTAINRFQALAEASKYIRETHDNHGAIGELLVSDIIFQEDQDGKLGKPVLNLPELIYNKNKITSEKDKKTTDMLDFVSSIFGEECRRSQDLGSADKALDVVLANYGDRGIISLIESFVKRGRLTLQGDAETLNLPDTVTAKTRGILSQHNKARLPLKSDFEKEMRNRIIGACERFLTKEQTSN